MNNGNFPPEIDSFPENLSKIFLIAADATIRNENEMILLKPDNEKDISNVEQINILLILVINHKV